MKPRSKGLSKVREVKRILQDKGYIVEGPGYRPVFFKKSVTVVHADYFGVFDLLSYKEGEGIAGHQVCAHEDKARALKKIKSRGIPGYLWTYDKDRGFNICKI